MEVMVILLSVVVVGVNVGVAVVAVLLATLVDVDGAEVTTDVNFPHLHKGELHIGSATS
jgi:hypothetical protein